MSDEQNAMKEAEKKPRQEKLPLTWSGEGKTPESRGAPPPAPAPAPVAKAPAAALPLPAPAREPKAPVPANPPPTPAPTAPPASAPVVRPAASPSGNATPAFAGGAATQRVDVSRATKERAPKHRETVKPTPVPVGVPAAAPAQRPAPKAPAVSTPPSRPGAQTAPATQTAPAVPAAAPVTRQPVAAPRPIPGRPATPAEPAAAAPRPATGGSTMGAKLREARDKRALTPAQVSQKIKIPQEFIALAEESRFADFPPPVYSRSYLGQLCREYGIDPAPLLEEYKAALRSTHAENDRNQLVLTSEVSETGAKVGYLPRSTAEGQEKVKKLSPTMMAVGVVLIGLVVLGLIVAVLHNRGGGTGDTGTPGTSAGAQVNLETFVTPQQLPMKELPVPNR